MNSVQYSRHGIAGLILLLVVACTVHQTLADDVPIIVNAASIEAFAAAAKATLVAKALLVKAAAAKVAVKAATTAAAKAAAETAVADANAVAAQAAALAKIADDNAYKTIQEPGAPLPEILFHKLKAKAIHDTSYTPDTGIVKEAIASAAKNSKAFGSWLGNKAAKNFRELQQMCLRGKACAAPKFGYINEVGRNKEIFGFLKDTSTKELAESFTKYGPGILTACFVLYNDGKQIFSDVAAGNAVGLALIGTKVTTELVVNTQASIASYAFCVAATTTIASPWLTFGCATAISIGTSYVTSMATSYAYQGARDKWYGKPIEFVDTTHFENVQKAFATQDFAELTKQNTEVMKQMVALVQSLIPPKKEESTDEPNELLSACIHISEVLQKETHTQQELDDVAAFVDVLRAFISAVSEKLPTYDSDSQLVA